MWNARRTLGRLQTCVWECGGACDMARFFTVCFRRPFRLPSQRRLAKPSAAKRLELVVLATNLAKARRRRAVSTKWAIGPEALRNLGDDGEPSVASEDEGGEQEGGWAEALRGLGSPAGTGDDRRSSSAEGPSAAGSACDHEDNADGVDSGEDAGRAPEVELALANLPGADNGAAVSSLERLSRTVGDDRLDDNALVAAEHFVSTKAHVLNSTAEASALGLDRRSLRVLRIVIASAAFDFALVGGGGG